MPSLKATILGAVLAATSVRTSPVIQSLDFAGGGDDDYANAPAADPSLTGYLGAFFLGADPYVYFYLSDGNNATSFRALNGGSPVLRPTLGTGGVRDPAIVTGGGAEKGKKWYIVGTDLDISKTTWDASQRQGSRGIFIWESTDLANWGDERLVVVEDETAGMVWAPEALWDATKGQYLVHWASTFYAASDVNHTGTGSATMIRYAHTSDFRTFTAPQTYVDKSPPGVIDMDILPVPSATADNNNNNNNNNNNADGAGQTFVRFLKDETADTVFLEVSTTGLFGAWTRPGGASAYIQSGVEGPEGFWDNEVPGLAHLLVDFYTADGYHPYQTDDVESNGGWTASPRAGFPSGLRHGSVLPITQPLVDALQKRWG